MLSIVSMTVLEQYLFGEVIKLHLLLAQSVELH